MTRGRSKKVKETPKRKSRRFVREGKIEIVEEHPRFIITRVQGDTRTYEQTHFDDETAYCTCRNPDMYCSHVKACWDFIPRKFRTEDNFKEQVAQVWPSDELDLD